MIATLTGVISDALLESVVLDVAGVGYGIYLTSEDQGRISQGQEAKLYIYEHIREQNYDLFGFLNLDTKYLFEQLLGVNGVGPKMALNVLSIGSSTDVRRAIASADTAFIQQASGVGKRVAERIIVDLKDKVGIVGVDLSLTGLLQNPNSNLQDEAVQALIALGYSQTDATIALQQVAPDLPTAERIKQALSKGN